MNVKENNNNVPAPVATTTTEPAVRPHDGEPLPMAVVTERMAFIDQIVRELLVEGRDFGRIPGTAKPVLYKPGAEKLGVAFQLSPTFEVLEHVSDDWKEWEYELYDKKTRRVYKRKARGFYKYRIRCRLIHRPTGALVAECEGVCASTERGREDAPENTIVKMAQKRAYVGAILIATYSSDRFTSDLEDYGEAGGHVPQPSSHQHGGSTPSPEPASPEDVVISHGKHAGKKLGELPTGYLQWMVDKGHDLADEAQAVLQKRAAKKDDAPPETPPPDDSASRMSVLQEIRQRENDLFDAGVLTTTDIERLRIHHTNQSDLDAVESLGALESYLSTLRSYGVK